MTLAHVAGLPLEELLLAAPLVVAWWRARSMFLTRSGGSHSDAERQLADDPRHAAPRRSARPL
jgi:hypothetical protein